MKPQLLRLGDFPPKVVAQIEARFSCHDEAALEADPALRESISGVITRSDHVIPPEALDDLPALRIIATTGVGYDGIPLALARDRGVVVTNTPGVLNAAVAEFAVAMLLGLLRKVPESDRYVRSGEWKKDGFPLAIGLSGKRVGIVGMGRIGKAVAERLAPFQVELAYYGRHDQGLEYRYEADLIKLATDSDVLVVVVPGGAATTGLIDDKVLAALGADGYLVNIARGTVVDEEALINALQNRRIAGAALDVFRNEPSIDPHFFTLDNVLLAPHAGSATVETRGAMFRLALDNLESFFSTGAALTPVPLPKA